MRRRSCPLATARCAPKPEPGAGTAPGRDVEIPVQTANIRPCTGCPPSLVSESTSMSEPAGRSAAGGRGGCLRMLQFVIAGLVLGGIYAIASAGLVITYTSSGILNFAFGAMAYFIARLLLLPQHPTRLGHRAGGDRIGSRRGPASLGVVLYFVLFRYLRLSSPLIKVVATIGLLVAIPSLATWIFGNQAIQQAPGLAPNPIRGLPVPGRPRRPEPDHRLHLRGGDGGARCRRPAVHRGRPQSAGHGRLAGHDRPVGHQPDGDLGRGVGGEHVLRRAGRRAHRAASSGWTRASSRSSSLRRSPPSWPPGCAACRWP